jgi:hypothetical protein
VASGEILEAKCLSSPARGLTWFGRKADLNDDNRLEGWQNPADGRI